MERSAAGWTLNAETWQSQLLSADEARELDDAAGEIVFAALVEYARQADVAILDVEEETGEDSLSADAALLVPGTRIHVQAGDTARNTIKGLVRSGVLFVISGDPTAFVGLSVDLMLGVFGTVSRLNEDEAATVRALLELSRSDGGEPSRQEDLARVLPDLEDRERVVDGLVERGVVAREAGRLRVVF